MQTTQPSHDVYKARPAFLKHIAFQSKGENNMAGHLSPPHLGTSYQVQ
jgi:hypothetical protein